MNNLFLMMKKKLLKSWLGLLVRGWGVSVVSTGFSIYSTRNNAKDSLAKSLSSKYLIRNKVFKLYLCSWFNVSQCPKYHCLLSELFLSHLKMLSKIGQECKDDLVTKKFVFLLQKLQEFLTCVFHCCFLFIISFSSFAYSKAIFLAFTSTLWPWKYFKILTALILGTSDPTFLNFSDSHQHFAYQFIFNKLGIL